MSKFDIRQECVVRERCVCLCTMVKVCITVYVNGSHIGHDTETCTETGAAMDGLII